MTAVRALLTGRARIARGALLELFLVDARGSYFQIVLMGVADAALPT